MVRIEKNGAVTTVILDRAEKRNAVDRETAHALADAFRAFEADDEARVGVLWGDHGTFCAGADLKSMNNRIEQDGDGPMGPTRMTLSKPVIAGIAGHAVAGGLELALWCDMRIVEEDATLGVFCRRWGVPLIDGGTVRLPRLIGLGHAMDMILTGRAVSANEALVMGLAQRVVPQGESRAEAEYLAAEVAKFPQACLLADRRSAYAQFGQTEAESLHTEFVGGKAVLGEAMEGAARFAAGAGRHGAFD